MVVAREETGETLPYVIEPAKADAKRRKLMVRREIRYGELAGLLGITVEAFNKLNGLSLDADTLLAAGPELYVPGLSPWLRFGLCRLSEIPPESDSASAAGAVKSSHPNPAGLAFPLADVKLRSLLPRHP